MNRIAFSRIAIATFFLAIGLSACRKQPDPVAPPTTPAGPGKLSVEITNQVNALAMQFGQWYITPPGDSIQVTLYKYYLSNISLTTLTGQTYTEPESYHLIDQNKPATRSILLSGVPEGDYASIRFMIGVDSLHNTTGAQAGDLDPKLGMIWTWNTGYIMAKMEGNAPNSPNSTKQFFYHVGGFKGEYNSTRWVTLTFPTTASVRADRKPNVHLTADLMRWFYGANEVRLNKVYNVMGEGRQANNMANNYQSMFQVDHVD